MDGKSSDCIVARLFDKRFRRVRTDGNPHLFAERRANKRLNALWRPFWIGAVGDEGVVQPLAKALNRVDKRSVDVKKGRAEGAHRNGLRHDSKIMADRATTLNLNRAHNRDVRQLDVSLFRWVNEWPDSLAPFFVFWSESNKWTWVRIVLLLILIGMLVRNPKTRGAAIAMLIAWPLANELTDVLKAWLQMQRPCVDLEDVRLRVKLLTSFGTASAHSANMAAVAFAATYRLGKWGWPWIPVALFTGISRIYVGVHYPSQVLFGWICGILVAFAVVKGLEAIERHIAARRETEPNDEQPEVA